MKDNWKLKYDLRWANTNQIIDTIFNSRCIKDKDEFLHPSAKNLIPFEFFTDISKGFKIVDTAIRENKKILIYGDVDTDGCTAASIVFRYLKNFTQNVDVCINEGNNHGLDIDEVRKFNPDTIIVVDSINDTPEDYLKALETSELVVLDHHIPSEEVLEIRDRFCLISSAIDNYPNPALSGAGVVWKFCKYLDSKYCSNYADDLADLAATGIVADMCSVGPDYMENRYICYCGFNNLKNPAIKAIMGDYDFNAKAVSFSIAPLINSANRLENNDEALNIFMLDDAKAIFDIVNNFRSYKKHQDTKVNTIYESIVKPTMEAPKDRKCLFCNLDGDKNFSGLVANKCVSEFHKPTIIYRIDEDGNMAGSMRATGVADFREMVNGTGKASCMGHENAAGFFCLKENFEQFKKIQVNIHKACQRVCVHSTYSRLDTALLNLCTTQ